MKGYVCKETCIGCGICISICPEVFHMGEDNKAVGKDEEIEDSLLEIAVEAKMQCPVSAISID